MTQPKTQFVAKTWMHYVGATFFTFFALFAAILGPLFLFGVMKSADGKPATPAGRALSIMAAPLGAVASLCWFNVIARRKPLLRICCEGIEVNVIGSSSLDDVPLIPKVVRVAWLLVSLEGFKNQIGWIPWSKFRGVRVVGLPMVRSLVIDGTVMHPSAGRGEPTAKFGESISFRDAEFADSLDEIASAIHWFEADPEAKESLTSLR